MVDADRALWDFNPILVSPYVSDDRAMNGKFYEISPDRAFTGMVRLLKDYVSAAPMDRQGAAYRQGFARHAVAQLCRPGRVPGRSAAAAHFGFPVRKGPRHSRPCSGERPRSSGPGCRATPRTAAGATKWSRPGSARS